MKRSLRAASVLAALSIAVSCTDAAVPRSTPRALAPTATPGERTTRPPAPSSRPPAATPTVTAFSSRIARVDRALVGWSWRPGCPVPLGDLRLLTLRYWDFDGVVRTGRLIVHERWARSITGVFRALFDARFPLERMALANEFPPNDTRRVAANLTTGFVCRPSVARPTRWSEHAYGRAVDINPLQNPYVSRRGAIIPTPWGEPYVDRSERHPGMIHANGVVVRAFRAIGWKWGGDFERSKDYHHFSSTGL